jgi:hypothetical protein
VVGCGKTEERVEQYYVMVWRPQDEGQAHRQAAGSETEMRESQKMPEADRNGLERDRGQRLEARAGLLVPNMPARSTPVWLKVAVAVAVVVAGARFSQNAPVCGSDRKVLLALQITVLLLLSSSALVIPVTLLAAWSLYTRNS